MFSAAWNFLKSLLASWSARRAAAAAADVPAGKDAVDSIRRDGDVIAAESRRTS